MNKSRIYSLDVFKLLLAYEIALYHLGVEYPPSPGVAVDFFFILSGLFLARKFYTQQENPCSAWDYTLNHAKGIYPHFLFSLAVFFGYNLLRSVIYLVLEPSWQSLWQIGANFYDLIPELTMLHSSHYFVVGLMYPTWQISALLIAGYFIYELLTQNERLTRCILIPLSILLVQSLMYSGAGYFDNYGPIYLPLARGFSALGIGVLTYRFLQTKQYRALTRHKLALNIGSLLAIAALMLYTDRGRIFLVVVPFLIVVCLDPDCWINRVLNHNCFRKAGKLSLAVYMNHSFINRITETQIQARFGFTAEQLVLPYLLVLTVYSIGTMIAVEWIMKRFRKNKK